MEFLFLTTSVQSDHRDQQTTRDNFLWFDTVILQWNMTAFTSFYSPWLTHFPYESFKVRDPQVIIIHQRGFLGVGRRVEVSWHMRTGDYGSSVPFGASRLSIQMKSYLIHLRVPVSKVQQSSLLGQIIGHFILPSHNPEVFCMYFCRRTWLRVLLFALTWQSKENWPEA